MSEYWKSVPRKFCEFCKCWLTDNKPSVEFHERGKRHQDNVAKKLTELRKKGKKDYEAKKKMDSQFRKMNDAAMLAYQKDVARDPSLARELEEIQKATATTSSEPAKPEPAPAIRGMNGRKTNAPPKQANSTPVPVYREVVSSDRSTPYGQWVTIESSVPKPIDLQLPEQREKIEYKVVSANPEELFKFKEKTVSSSNVVFSKGDATFRKRKFNAGSFTRNMRRKEENEDAD